MSVKHIEVVDVSDWFNIYAVSYIGVTFHWDMKYFIIVTESFVLEWGWVDLAIPLTDDLAHVTVVCSQWKFHKVALCCV